MPKIMETNAFQAFLFQQHRESAADIVGFHSSSQCINKYISVIGVVISISAYFFILLLRFSNSEKILSELANKGKRAQTGFCLC